jgi:flagella basal body P-ring formation protein FlgA
MILLIHGKDDLGSNHRGDRHLLYRLLALILLPTIILADKATASEADSQSLLSIKDTVRAFITRQIGRDYPHHEIKVGNLDPRLKLSTCDHPLEGFLPPGGRLLGATTIGIRCIGDKPWTVYIPVAVKAKRMVVITTHPILRNAAITKSDIRLEERNVMAESDAYIFDPEYVLGKLSKRALTTSTALTPDMLNAPLFVRRGQQVIILAEDSGIDVRMAGTALMDGAEGQVIRVQNALSKRTVEGQVVRPGIIRVNM